MLPENYTHNKISNKILVTYVEKRNDWVHNLDR